MEMNEPLYIVYGSHNGGRFKAMNMNEGVQTNNLIYATIYYTESLDKVRAELKKIEEQEPEWKFEIRKKG